MSRSKEELRQFLVSVDGVSRREVPVVRPWIESVRERWRYLKATHGLNQYDLEAWTGVAQATLSSLLGRNSRGTPSTSPGLERISLALGISVPEAVEAVLLVKEAADLGAPVETMRGVKVIVADAIDMLKSHSADEKK